MDVYTLLYLKWITKKDLPYSTGHSAQRHMAAWMGGEVGRRMNMYMYMYIYICICTCICIHVYMYMYSCRCRAESFCCPSETVIVLLISYTPIQNKRLKTIQNPIVKVHPVLTSPKAHLTKEDQA